MHLYEELQLKLFSCLNTDDLITFCYVSKYFRKLVLKEFSKIYEISTGFCSVKHWPNLIKRNVSELINDIHGELFHTLAFDFEKNYDNLIKKFRHMSLLSVCLHFLRCKRSCEKKSDFCKVCSRVRENTFYEYNAFLNLKLNVEDYLNINSSEQIDLDVFLTKPAFFTYCTCDAIGRNYSDFEVFNHARDLFAAFCSVLVRMYLNYTTAYFLDLQVSLSDQKKIIQTIFRFACDLLETFLILITIFFMNW